MKIELVVFDIAGTTVKDNGNVATSFIDAFQSYGLKTNPQEVNAVMGFRKIDAIEILLDKLEVKTENRNGLVEKIHNRFIDSMVEFYKTDPSLAAMKDAEEVFAQLHNTGIKIALNTGFTKSITDTILERLKWNNSQHIDAVISSDQVPEGRPHPYMIRKIMEQLGVNDVKAVAKVGDTEVDVAEGRNAGCGVVISVTSGAYSRSQLEQYKPDHIVDNLSSIPSILYFN
jgi:phosphonatase-like hydrolase